MKPPLLSVRDLHFAHGDQHEVLRGVDLDMAQGEVLLIHGESGSGKSTLLRIIAGLDRQQKGEVLLNGHMLANQGTFMAPEDRPVGMVFQGLALFPHLSVEGNLAFGLHGVPGTERKARIAAELKAVGLEGMEGRYPHQLSGGQQQRVAIARSLVRRPALLLMDEPFSDLDHATRERIRSEVGRILRAHGSTAIIVSHDPGDAMGLADRTAVMANGVLELDQAKGSRHEQQQA